MSANGHEVGGVRVFRAKRQGKFADVLFDFIRINHAIGFERANSLKAFLGERVNQFLTSVPAIA